MSSNASHAVVGISLRGQGEIGSTFMTVLQRYAEALQARDSKLMLIGVDAAVRDQLAKTGVLKLIGDGERLSRHAAAWRRDEPGGCSGPCLARSGGHPCGHGDRRAGRVSAAMPACTGRERLNTQHERGIAR